jgi:Polyketide cyclase / dehydrase and lipid transport
MLKIIGIVAGVGVLAIIALLVYAATFSDTFQVQRTQRISASPDKIFPLINNIHSMNTWNPFAEADPEIKITYRGPDSGKGARYEWTGNSKVGQGSIEIIDVAAPSRVALRLDTLKPMEGHHTVVFTLAPNGSGTDASTDVTWAMIGERPFIGKVMDAVFNMDRMVGGQFEKGLAKLRAIAEKA